MGNVEDVQKVITAMCAGKCKITISSIQRFLQCGYNRAAEIMDFLEQQGIVSEIDANNRRQLLKK